MCKSLQHTIITVCLQELFQIGVIMFGFLVKYRQIASSANGRHIGSEPINRGSNPCEATHLRISPDFRILICFSKKQNEKNS